MKTKLIELMVWSQQMNYNGGKGEARGGLGRGQVNDKRVRSDSVDDSEIEEKNQETSQEGRMEMYDVTIRLNEKNRDRGKGLPFMLTTALATKIGEIEFAKNP